MNLDGLVLWTQNDQRLSQIHQFAIKIGWKHVCCITAEHKFIQGHFHGQAPGGTAAQIRWLLKYPYSGCLQQVCAAVG